VPGTRCRLPPSLVFRLPFFALRPPFFALRLPFSGLCPLSSAFCPPGPRCLQWRKIPEEMLISYATYRRRKASIYTKAAAGRLALPSRRMRSSRPEGSTRNMRAFT
jgi:hypothetical protein